MKINLYIMLCLALFPFIANAQQLKINEVMASNTATIASDLGNFGDWVEIYNPSNNDIDLAGLYFTDDIATPTKYQFPATANSIVPANGYKLIWADDSAQFLHANFKLSGSTGETIAIFAANGITLLDSVSFGIQTTDVSFGRTTDGGINWTTFSASTPEATNGPTTLQSDIQFNSQFKIFPNPASNSFSILENNWENIIITDLNGKQILSLNNSNFNNKLIDISNLKVGIYFIQIISAEKFYSTKLIKY